MPKEDEPRGIIAPLKENIIIIAQAVSPSNIIKQINKMKAMSAGELVIYILTTKFWIVCWLGSCLLSILGFVLTLMRGSFGQEEKSAKELELLNSKKKSKLNIKSVNINSSYEEGPGKSESQDSSEGEKDEAGKRSGGGGESVRRSGVQLSDEERRISLYIPSQELTLHSLKSGEQ